MELSLFWLEIVVFLVLVGLSAFFAAAETALTSAPESKMQTLEMSGDHRAAAVNYLRAQKERLLSAMLFGNRIPFVGATVLMTVTCFRLWGTAGAVYAFFTAFTILMVFGEVVPKLYGMINAERVSLAVAQPVRIFLTVLAPVITGVERGVRMIFGALGLEHTELAAAYEEKLRGAIQLFKDNGDPDDEEDQERGAMMRSILDLADVQVEEIMVHRKNVRMINADLPVTQIMDEVLSSTFTRLPAWRNTPDNIIGVINAKLLLREVSRCGGDVDCVKIENAMMEPWFIPDTTTLFDQLQAFRKRREHFSIMVDEYGALMGVVTLEDILEEIVGDISDESDITVPGIRPQSDGSYLVDGKITIRDLNRAMDWGLPDEEYSTLAGLLIFETQRIPAVGQHFTFFGFRFEIVKKHKNQISLVRIFLTKTETQPI